MFRYMCFVWSAGEHGDVPKLEERLQRSGIHWESVYRDQGCAVLCAGDRVASHCCGPVDGHGGVVLGTIFARPTDTRTAGPLRSFSSAEWKKICASRGRHLIDAYWGSYVAVLRGGAARTTDLIRSPCGNLPCLAASWRGIRIYFSYAPDCASLRMLDLSINWHYVARFITRSASAEETGLHGVTEVRPGVRVEIASGRESREHIWNPARIAATDVIEDAQMAARQVRAMTRACVHAWASAHDSILHNLSGGLDSSIVLSCLADAPSSPRIVCLNHYSVTSNGDERQFARLAAQGAQCELVEHQANAQVRLRAALDAGVSECPLPYFGDLHLRRFRIELARRSQAGAVFSGDHGDELFMASVRQAAADYLRLHGFDRTFLRIVAQRSRNGGMSLWRALREAIATNFARPRWNTLADSRQYNVLLRDEVLDELEREETSAPPWYLADAGTPVGKQRHIASVIKPDLYYFPLAEPNDPEQIAPLLSQPLVELCLRIPIHVLTVGGTGRALARRAFVGDVPPQILQRYSKGGVGEYAFAVLYDNLDFVRELLLDGALVRQGYLHRGRLADVLSGRPSSVTKGVAKLFLYLQTEIWLQIVSRNDLRAAA